MSNAKTQFEAACQAIATWDIAHEPELHELQLRLIELERERTELEDAESQALSAYVSELVGEDIAVTSYGNAWQCQQSPTRYCLYDETDHLWQVCVFCDEPIERK